MLNWRAGRTTWTFYLLTTIHLCIATSSPAAQQEERIEYGTFVVPPSQDEKGFEEFSIRAALPCTNCWITHAQVQVLCPEQQAPRVDVLLDQIIFCNDTARQGGDRCTGESLLLVEPGIAETSEAEEERQEQRSRSYRANRKVPSVSGSNAVFILTGMLNSTSSVPTNVTLAITWTIISSTPADTESAQHHQPLQPLQQAQAIFKSTRTRFRLKNRKRHPSALQQDDDDDSGWWVVTFLIAALSCASLATLVAFTRREREGRYALMRQCFAPAEGKDGPGARSER